VAFVYVCVCRVCMSACASMILYVSVRVKWEWTGHSWRNMHGLRTQSCDCFFVSSCFSFIVVYTRARVFFASVRVRLQ
jgi:hypothetical protein